MAIPYTGMKITLAMERSFFVIIIKLLNLQIYTLGGINVHFQMAGRVCYSQYNRQTIPQTLNTEVSGVVEYS